VAAAESDTAAPAAGTQVAALVAPSPRPAAATAIDDVLTASDETTGATAAAAAEVPLPSARPSALDASYAVAALTGVRPTELAATAGEEAPFTRPEQKSGRPVSDSQRLALLSNRQDLEPAAIISGGIRTTPKAGKPRAADGRPTPAPQVLPVRAEAARWALKADSVTMNDRSTTLPSFNSEVVRLPEAVYTTGFQPRSETVDYQRFSGQAVRFFSLARFEPRRN
ncbi:hypothetical protein N1F89_13750, partial [Aquibium sp. A9E412]|nr:hypothetical protein [Aquibium sp. A9E412]